MLLPRSVLFQNSIATPYCLSLGRKMVLGFIHSKSQKFEISSYENNQLSQINSNIHNISNCGEFFSIPKKNLRFINTMHFLNASILQQPFLLRNLNIEGCIVWSWIILEKMANQMSRNFGMIDLKMANIGHMPLQNNSNTCYLYFFTNLLTLKIVVG